MRGNASECWLAIASLAAAGCAPPSTPFDARQAAKAGASDEVAQLIDTLDDNFDPAHSEYTPSVFALRDMGEPVLVHMLPLMLSDNTDTRLHAQTVLFDVTLIMHGFEFGHVGAPQTAIEDEWRVFWRKLGSLQYDAPLPDRQRAVRLWQEWLDTKKLRNDAPASGR